MKGSACGEDGGEGEVCCGAKLERKEQWSDPNSTFKTFFSMLLFFFFLYSIVNCP